MHTQIIYSSFVWLAIITVFLGIRYYTNRTFSKRQAFVLLFVTAAIPLLMMQSKNSAFLEYFRWLSFGGHYFAAFMVFIVSVLTAAVLIYFQKSIPLLDIPNNRSSHATPTPKSGGIAIIVSFFAGYFLFDFHLSLLEIVAILTVVLLGIYDDMHRVRARTKLFFVLISASIFYFSGVHFDSLGSFLGHEMTLGVAAFFVFVFAISGFTNALNLIDGLDGLAGGVVIVMLLGFAYIGERYGDAFIYYASISLILGILGFLVFNWHPAKLFMGDNGSLFLGFVTAIIAVKSLKYIQPVTILLICALPIMDTILVSAKRIASGLNPFSPDKRHIHHIILRLRRGNVANAVMLLISIQFFFTFVGMAFKAKDDLFVLVVFLSTVVIFYELLYPAERRH